MTAVFCAVQGRLPAGALCVPLPHDRALVVPAHVPVSVVVIVLLVVGYDLSAAVTAVTAIAATSRSMSTAC
ncbi:hypothetical protein [Streptomyces sp. NPDC017958]|uniref:hypothetical protein n=1 Tax=Streptomyces sp. NPDC017958 TaxID=3365021 RepID=UPI003789A85C